MLGLSLRIARVISFILLGLALLLPWYHVPGGLRQDPSGAYAVMFSEPVSTLVYKVLLVTSLITGLVYRMRRSTDPAKRLAIISGTGLFLLVVFATSFAPLTMQRCAQVAARGEWLADQNFSLVLPTGDSLTEEEYSYQSSEPLVTVTDVMPRSFQTMPVPEFRSAFDLHVTQLPQITMWVGYTSGFCQFAGRGWFCALFGSMLLFASFSRQVRVIPGQKIKPTWRLVAVAALVTVALEVFWLAFPLMAGLQIHEARVAASQGQFKESRKDLDCALVFLPALQFNTDILYEKGWLDQKIGRESPESNLVRAIKEEVEHLKARASAHYSQLLNVDNPQPVQAEAFRGALRLALRDLNSGLEENGASRLAELLAIDPTCIKANYALQLADLRMHRKAELKRDVAQFETVYKTFQSLEKIAPIATGHRRIAELDFETNDTADLGDQMRAAIKQ